jgi:hypothetical protein
MNRDLIKKTAITRWEPTERVYVTESPLFDKSIGVGRTTREAQRIFRELVDDCYVVYLEGRLAGYDKPGRPAKGGVAVHVAVPPQTKTTLTQLAGDLGCTQGEALAYLAAFWRARNTKQPTAAPRKVKKRA